MIDIRHSDACSVASPYIAALSREEAFTSRSARPHAEPANRVSGAELCSRAFAVQATSSLHVQCGPSGFSACVGCLLAVHSFQPTFSSFA